jgi:hypothetical protein
MNSALTNDPEFILPAYDLGAVLQWNIGPWSLRGVSMNVGLDEDEDEAFDNSTNLEMDGSYNYVGGQIGYSIHSWLGDGSMNDDAFFNAP